MAYCHQIDVHRGSTGSHRKLKTVEALLLGHHHLSLNMTSDVQSCLSSTWLYFQGITNCNRWGIPWFFRHTPFCHYLYALTFPIFSSTYLGANRFIYVWNMLHLLAMRWTVLVDDWPSRNYGGRSSVWHSFTTPGSHVWGICKHLQNHVPNCIVIWSIDEMSRNRVCELGYHRNTFQNYVGERRPNVLPERPSADRTMACKPLQPSSMY
jgi:hypothetical protein